MSNLYALISSLCENRGVTLYRMSEELEIRRSTFSDLKAGRKKTLTAETLAKIADYFGVTVDYLLTGEQKSPPAAAEGDMDLSFLLDSDTFMLDGQVTDPETAEYLRNSFAATIEYAKKINREKKDKG